MLAMQANAFASIIYNDVIVEHKGGSPMRWDINKPEWYWIGTHTKAQIDQGAITLKVLNKLIKFHGKLLKFWAILQQDDCYGIVLKAWKVYSCGTCILRNDKCLLRYLK